MTSTSSYTMSAPDPTRIYPLYVRVRGSVELMQYTGGVRSRYLVVGGVPLAGAPNTTVKLELSDPVTVLWLNGADAPTAYSVPLDYYLLLFIRGNGTLTLTLTQTDSSLHKLDQGGGVPVLLDLPSFDGEFVQLNFFNEVDSDIIEHLGGSARGWIFNGFDEMVSEYEAER